jgi:uncharacterized protein YprB with RNaseH-like and TPR domain
MVPLEDVVAGEAVRTEMGCYYVSRSCLHASERHGHARIGDFIRPSMKAAAFIAGSDPLKDFTIEDGLFLDTETTGLAGGTGTFPFLIGLGWFEDGGFITHQLFARDFSEEPAMLTALCELAARRKFLVTFNGKSYDVNLLATRFVLNRCPDILSGMLQCDLLHPSRRIFSHRLENSRLGTLETSLLGVRRSDDVPSHEIPQRYFDWLKRRDGRLMEDVFRHNRLDIVSMAALLKHITDLAENGLDEASSHPADMLSVARLYADRGELAAARRIFKPLCRFDHPEIVRSARMSLSLIHKKANRWDDAVSLWKEMAAADPCDVFAAEELAKWYEHRVRNIGLAIAIVQHILNGNKTMDEAERQSMTHRLRRLIHRAEIYEK